MKRSDGVGRWAARGGRAGLPVVLAMLCCLAWTAVARGQGMLRLAVVGEGEPAAAEVKMGPRGGVTVGPPDVAIMPPRPPVTYRPVLPAELSSLDVRVEIEGQVATTSLDETFRNPNDSRVEGTYLFPLPLDAAVRDLSLFIDGKPVKCEVVEAAKARKIYEDIVRQMRDPALLEYVDRDLIKIRIFPIEPHQDRRIQFKYSQVLRRDAGLTEYAFPLAAPQDAGRPIGQLHLSGTIRSDQAVGSVYSPTHALDFRRPDEKSATFEVDKKNAAGGRDLKIYYSTSEKDLGAALLTYRDKGEKGYFLLLVSPARDAADKRPVLPKDVTFVLDTSGSMRGEKIQQARDALKFCLKSLRPEDRFRIVRFSTDVETFDDNAKAATPENVARAIKFVDGFEATGGTAIGEALREALAGKTEEGRPNLVVFLTDGTPTVGETDVNRLLEGAAQRNKDHRRIFCFGVGFEVNTKLLDRLSDESGGAADYVAPQEDIEVKVSSFFRKVADPVMTGVSLDFGKIKVSEYQPRGLPDLFAGSQTTVVGRYEESGEATVVLKGREGKEERAFEYNLKFPEESHDADFLPRLWAVRRVGYLVEQIRSNGENAELKDEVVRLGKKFAIATPYTSLLVTEDEPMARGTRPMPAAMPLAAPVPRNAGNQWHTSNGGEVPKADAPKAEMRAAAKPAGAPVSAMEAKAGAVSANADMAMPAGAAARGLALNAVSGEAAVAASLKTRSMKEAVQVGADRKDLSGEETQTRTLGARTFYLRAGVWTDSEYDGKAKTTDVEYGSDEYFQLAAKGGDMAKYLALGEQVIFKADGKWYRVTAAKAQLPRT